MLTRRQFLKSLTCVPLLSICWRQQNDLSLDELEVLAETKGGKWIDIYLMRIN